jgi:phosphatidylinositol 3-kinase
MDQWREVDTADALELLSEEFGHDDVRAFAVHQLEGAEDSELQCYLLQLVQALRYEPLCPSELSNFLVRRCAATFEVRGLLWRRAQCLVWVA